MPDARDNNPASGSPRSKKESILDASSGFQTPAVRALAILHQVDPGRLRGTGAARRVTRRNLIRDVTAPRTSIAAASAGFQTPAVRASQRRHELDLQHEPGTGANGRTTKRNVLNRLATMGATETPCRNPSDRLTPLVAAEVDASWLLQRVVAIGGSTEVTNDVVAAVVEVLRRIEPTLRPPGHVGVSASASPTVHLEAAPLNGCVAHLSIGAIKQQVVVVTNVRGEDAIAIRPCAFLCFTYDDASLSRPAAVTLMEALVNRLTRPI
jgi:pyruvate/2-oxoglutarate dehydrogenase complex dihydrolipoamide acyltransferase (E2) component